MALTKPDIKSLLASALGRRDEVPNIELAERIAHSNDQAAVDAVAAILETGARAVRHDAIKVLYEVGERNPRLILSQFSVFLSTISDKDNRMVWGGLTALAKLSDLAPEKVFPHLDEILRAADAGSVIAKDRAIDILVSLAGTATYFGEVMPTIINRLKTSAVNQLPKYAEKTNRLTLPQPEADEVKCVLKGRIHEPMGAAKKKRIEKVIDCLS